jgi:ABC-type cobalamin transport system ATPase subunit
VYFLTWNLSENLRNRADQYQDTNPQRSHILSHYLSLVRFNHVLNTAFNKELRMKRLHDKSTLMMMTRVDWNRDGLAAGSRMTEDAWNDWKRSAMSRDRAKLFLKRTLWDDQP